MLRDTLSFSLLRLSAIDLSFDSVLKGILVKHSQDFALKNMDPRPRSCTDSAPFLADEPRHTRLHISSCSLSICKTLFWQDFTFFWKKKLNYGLNFSKTIITFLLKKAV